MPPVPGKRQVRQFTTQGAQRLIYMLAGQITVELNLWVTRYYLSELSYGCLAESAVGLKAERFRAQRELKRDIKMPIFQFQQQVLEQIGSVNIPLHRTGVRLPGGEEMA